MTRADAWIHFAAAALASGEIGVVDSSDSADRMLAEFNKRFVSKFGTFGNQLGVDSGLFFEREKKP